MNLPKFLTTVTSFSKILAAVLFITLPFVGFYVGLKYEAQFTKYLEDRTTLNRYNIKPSLTTDETANWKTYTNKKYGYSFSYPDAWFVSGISADRGAIIVPCSESNTEANIMEFSKIKLTDCGFIGDQLPNSEAEFTIWVLDEPWRTEEILTRDATGKDISKEILITGEKATKTPFTEKSYLPNIQATRIYFNHNDKGYLMFLRQTDRKGNYDPVFDQILATFKFTDQIEGL